MLLANRPLLRDFAQSHARAKKQLENWEAVVQKAHWSSPNELKRSFSRKASVLKGGNVIFDICGNDYRIWTKIDFEREVVMVKRVGTHQEYDNWKIT